MHAFTERSVVGTLFKNYTRPTHNFTETFVIYRRSILKRCTYPVHPFPERSVVDAVSEREVLKTSSVFLQPIEHKLMKHLGSSERSVGLHHIAHIQQLGSTVVKQESRVESATARKQNKQDDD